MQVVLTPKPMLLTNGSQVETIWLSTLPLQRYLTMSLDILIVTARPTTGHWELYSVLCGDLNGKAILNGGYIYIHV